MTFHSVASRLRFRAEPASRAIASEAEGLLGAPPLATTVAVGVAFALILLPAVERDTTDLLVAAGLGAVLIALSLLWRLLPRLVGLAVPLGYLAFIDLLRSGVGGGASGFGGLLLLPVIWLALSAGALELLIVLVGMLAAQVVPLIAVGGTSYPSSLWRATLVLTTVAAIAGFTIQRLLAETRKHANENARLYQEANRWVRRLESLSDVGNALATETERALDCSI